METIPSNQHTVTHQYLEVDNSIRKGDTAVSDWLITLVIMMIPLINFVMLFVWAFGGNGEKVSRANWAKATLLLMLVIAGMYFLLASILGIGLISILNN